MYEVFKARRRAQWPALRAEIEQAITSVRTSGFCAASWQPEVVALASPITTAVGCYSLNVSVSSVEPMEVVVQTLTLPLLELRAAISNALSRHVDA